MDAAAPTPRVITRKKIRGFHLIFKIIIPPLFMFINIYVVFVYFNTGYPLFYDFI